MTDKELFAAAKKGKAKIIEAGTALDTALRKYLEGPTCDGVNGVSETNIYDVQRAAENLRDQARTLYGVLGV